MWGTLSCNAQTQERELDMNVDGISLLNHARKFNYLRRLILSIQWRRLQGSPTKINKLSSVELS